MFAKITEVVPGLKVAGAADDARVGAANRLQMVSRTPRGRAVILADPRLSEVVQLLAQAGLCRPLSLLFANLTHSHTDQHTQPDPRNGLIQDGLITRLTWVLGHGRSVRRAGLVGSSLVHNPHPQAAPALA